jgi:3-methyladenine DNA glycosylase AlkD
VPAKSPATVAREVKRQLAELGRPAGAFDAQRYFRGTGELGFHNVGTPRVRRLARDLVKQHCDVWSIREALELTHILIQDRFLETKGFGIEVLARYRREFTPALLPVWKQWLAAGYASNWATTDAICGMLIGPLVFAHPHLAPRLAGWVSHRNLWVRRAAAVGLIPLIRRGQALPLGYQVASQLHKDEADLIQKAVGWMLREAGKADAPRLERYLRQNGPRIPRTTVRYAIERFAPALRGELLQVTRAKP